jgi:hypothetical protein
MHNSDMPAIERDIQGFLNIIRPTSLSLLGDSDSDQECPICHELFPEFDYDGFPGLSRESMASATGVAMRTHLR